MVEREEARISLNSLTEYISASPSRRRTIIEQQKRPQDFQVIFYEFAQDKIAEFIATGMASEEPIVSEIDRLYAQTPRNEYEESRFLSNAEALESFLEFYSDIDIGGLTARRGASSQRKLTFAQIDLSVRPEILLSGSLPRMGNAAGAIKLYFTKKDKLRLSSATGPIPAAIVYEFLRQTVLDVYTSSRYSMVIDVFGQSIWSAPKAYRRLLRDVETACEEIQLWWERV